MLQGHAGVGARIQAVEPAEQQTLFRLQDALICLYLLGVWEGMSGAEGGAGPAPSTSLPPTFPYLLSQSLLSPPSSLAGSGSSTVS